MSNEWFDFLIVGLLACIGYIAVKARQAEVTHVPAPSELVLEKEKIRYMQWYPKRIIRQCGLSPQNFRSVYWLSKLVLCLLILLLYFETPEHWRSQWLIVGSLIIAFFALDLWLLNHRRRRQREISRSLPFFVSVLVVYLKSGMGLAKALAQAGEHGLTHKNPLAKEVGLLNLEFEAGRSRDDTFKNLAHRTGVKELERLASVLSVGFKIGSPVAETLHTQAELMRVKQIQQGSKLVNRKTMEAMLPMSLVCFPMFAVLIFYPAASQIFDVLKLLQELF